MLVTVLGFQADRYLHYRAIHRINLEHCLAGVTCGVQPIFVNAVPLKNVGVMRGTVLGLKLRSGVAAVGKLKDEVGVCAASRV